MQLLNLGGFGMAAWEERSFGPSRPFTYRTVGVPMFDRNLKRRSRRRRQRVSGLADHRLHDVFRALGKIGLASQLPGACEAPCVSQDVLETSREF
jgi:hypothetical protein